MGCGGEGRNILIQMAVNHSHVSVSHSCLSLQLQGIQPPLGLHTCAHTQFLRKSWLNSQSPDEVVLLFQVLRKCVW